jgi:adenylate kinase
MSSMHARCVPTSKTPGDAAFWPAAGTAVERTFAILKPDIVNRPWVETHAAVDEEGNETVSEEVLAQDRAAAVMERISAEGFTVVARRRLLLSKQQAQEFYAEHKGRSFFEGLTDFMSSGPIIALVLERVDAIASWRSLIGPTNSNDARAAAAEKNPLDVMKWTLRAQHGTDGQRNACHGSDSTFSATREINFFFPSKSNVLERTCALLLPGADVAAAEADLAAAGVVVIARATRTPSASEADQLFPEGHAGREAAAGGACTALALEGMNAVDAARLAMGVEGREGVHIASSAEAASAALHWWFKTPFQAERTLAMIKPGTAQTSLGPILDDIAAHGFTVVAQRKVHMSQATSAKFYVEHAGKGFYKRLTTYMSSAPVVALVLSKPGAIKAWRTLMGPTNTFVARKTQPRSLRARFGVDGTRNATHGSDSTGSAQREISFFFPRLAGGNGEVLTGDAARAYLKEKACTEAKTMNQVLVDGLVKLCQAKPVGLDAVRWLGEWLVANNPSRPVGAGAQTAAASTVDPVVVVQPPAPSAPASSAAPTPASFPGGKSRAAYANAGAIIDEPAPSARTIVFALGGPGAGKGTQCARAVKEFGFTHLSTGDLLRAEAASGSEQGQRLAAIMSKGELVPDEEILAMLKAAMDRSGANKFLLDGYPRKLEQAFKFEQQVGACSFCVSFDCSDETMKARLMKRGETSGRSDDADEATIATRIKTFHDESEAAIDFYERLGRLRRVDSEQDVDTIWAQVRTFFQPRVVFVTGPPGAGKGTQCTKIAARYGYEHISAGDLLRAEVARGSKDGATIERLIRNGQLVPDDLTLKVIQRAISRSASNAFLLDGYPRTMKQALAFEHAVAPCEFVLNLSCPDSVCRERLIAAKSGRIDDTKAAITKRLNTYNRQTRPVVDVFAASNSLRDVDGAGTAEDVFRACDPAFAPKVVFAVAGPGYDVAGPCKRLAAQFGYTHLDAADLLRAEVARGVGIGLTIERMISDGMIVPVELTLEVLTNAMRGSGNDKFILTGFPRAVDEVQAFERTVASCSSVLYFDAPEAALRAAGADDRAMRSFQTGSLAAVNYFALQGFVRRVDCSSGDLEVAYAQAAATMKSECVFVVGANADRVAQTCGNLRANCGFVHLSCDGILAAEVQRGSDLGRDIGQLTKQGKIVPTSTKISLLKAAMQRNHRVGKFAVEGFPSAQDQAAGFEGAMGAPTQVLYLDDDVSEGSVFSSQTMPVVNDYATKGLVRTVNGRGDSDADVWARVRKHYSPTIVLLAAAASDANNKAELPKAMVKLCLDANCARVNVARLVDAERSADTKLGADIRTADAKGSPVPSAAIISLIQAAIAKAPTSRVLLQGFPRLQSAADGVVAQVDALETAIGEVVHMLSMENSELGETSAFRLETAPVCRYFETRGALSKFDMAGGISAEMLIAASDKLVSMFDAETRARLAGLALAESTRVERERLEAERKAAEDDLGGGQDAEEEDDEEA